MIKTRKEYLRMLALVLPVLAAMAIAVNGCMSVKSTKGVRLAKDGKPLVEIVVAENAVPNESLACKELEDHLEKIVGARFTVVNEKDFASGKGAIYLGQTRFAEKAGVNFAKLGEEEMIIRTKDGNLIISGGRPRGTLYAVYEFLERQAGCHWLAWDTTVTPRKPDFAIPAIDVNTRPAFSSRRFELDYVTRLGNGEVLKKFSEFCGRNRECGGQPPYTEGRPHTFYMFVDPKEWFEKHSEYYSMDGSGKRTFGNPGPSPGAAGSELCLSNPELPGVMAKSALKFIKAREDGFAKRGLKPDSVDISAEDNAGFICKCPACTAISKEEGSESGLLIRFVNQVADLIARERPDVKVRTLSYVSTDVAPLLVKARDNVIVQWCDLYGSSDCFRPLEHPVNKGQLELLQGWAKTTKNIEIWDYWNMGGGSLAGATVPEFVSAGTIAADARTFKKSNVKGIFVEYEMGFADQNFFALSLWAGLQLMSNPELQADELVATFMDGYYGPAAEPMKAFYDMLEKAMMDEKESMQLSNNSSRRSYLNMGFLSRCRDVLLKAEAATASGSPERIHVWREMIVVYNCVLNQWDRMKRQEGKEFPFPKAETLEKYAQMREAVIMYWWRDDAEYPPGRKRRPVLLEDLKKEMECLRVSFPLPERFKNLPATDVIDLPYVKLSWSKEDPEATGGKAVYFNLKDRAPYREKEPAPIFFLYDGPSKRSGPTLEIKDIPADEKYHLYKMGAFALGKDTIICGHWSWIMNCAWLAPQYVNADGMKSNPNEWDVYISVKVTGPVYVPGSTNENALWLDRVILVKPEK